MVQNPWWHSMLSLLFQCAALFSRQSFLGFSAKLDLVLEIVQAFKVMQHSAVTLATTAEGHSDIVPVSRWSLLACSHVNMPLHLLHHLPGTFTYCIQHSQYSIKTCLVNQHCMTILEHSTVFTQDRKVSFAAMARLLLSVLNRHANRGCSKVQRPSIQM